MRSMRSSKERAAKLSLYDSPQFSARFYRCCGLSYGFGVDVVVLGQHVYEREV